MGDHFNHGFMDREDLETDKPQMRLESWMHPVEQTRNSVLQVKIVPPKEYDFCAWVV